MTTTSCFPIVPKLACDHLGLDIVKPAKPYSLLGGLTSFGGAGNNYSMHVSSLSPLHRLLVVGPPLILLILYLGYCRDDQTAARQEVSRRIGSGQRRFAQPPTRAVPLVAATERRAVLPTEQPYASLRRRNHCSVLQRRCGGPCNNRGRV